MLLADIGADIGYGLSGLLGLGIIFIGTRFLLAPQAASASFGIAAGPDGGSADPYLSVKGVRDIASGLVVFILLAAGEPRLPERREPSSGRATLPATARHDAAIGAGRNPVTVALGQCWPEKLLYFLLY